MIERKLRDIKKNINAGYVLQCENYYILCVYLSLLAQLTDKQSDTTHGVWWPGQSAISCIFCKMRIMKEVQTGALLVLVSFASCCVAI